MDNYIFFRILDGKEIWYPIQLENDAVAIANAEINPGTTRVEDLNSRIVWKARPIVPYEGPSGSDLIVLERQRQIDEEGYTAENDDNYTMDEFVLAASCYIFPESGYSSVGNREAYVKAVWPWENKQWKPSSGNRIKELVKAGALIAAEIDRLNRLG